VDRDYKPYVLPVSQLLYSKQGNAMLSNPIDRWTIQVNDQNLSLRLYLSYSSHNSFHVSLCTSRICFLGEVPSAFPMFQWKPFIPLQQGFNENSSEMGKDILVYISLNKARLPLQETQISEHS
jgi:hypothetical protein